MRKILISMLIPIAAALGLLLVTGTASASHATHAPAKHQTTMRIHTATTNTSTKTETKDATESESAADAAAQHAGCLKVGIDDTVTPDVQYDDQTGGCSLDTGGDNEAG